MQDTADPYEVSLPDLDSDAKRPLHHKILAMLREQIEGGVFKAGDLLPSESQLCRRYQVSRTTVRQAFEQLAAENLIVRRRGQGTFVAEKKLSRQLSHLYSFTEDMQALGLKPSSQVIACQGIVAPPAIAAKLKLASDHKVFWLCRVRCADDQAILLENTYLPYDLVRDPDIGQLDFATASLYQTLRQTYGLRLERALETYEAVFLTADTAKRLACAENLPAFRIRRIAYLENGQPFELTEAIARGDKCQFQVDLQTRQKKIAFSRQIRP